MDKEAGIFTVDNGHHQENQKCSGNDKKNKTGTFESETNKQQQQQIEKKTSVDGAYMCVCFK